MGDIFHPDGAVLMYLRIFGNQLPGHQGHVIGGGHVAVHVKAAAVYKIGVFHAQVFGPLIHAADKFLLAAPDVFCHGYTCGIYT